MAYKTYTTKAIVCGNKDRNTSDRSYMLFTREAGMIFADAKSSRKEFSKQRGPLQDFSLVKVSLIKGKYTWKIGSIEAYKNYYLQAINKLARGSTVAICRLLRRFVKGEQVDVELFDYVVLAIEELNKKTEERDFVQMVVQVHILGLLGYVDVSKIPNSLFEIEPKETVKYYDDKIFKQIEMLYTQAVTISDL